MFRFFIVFSCSILILASLGCTKPNPQQKPSSGQTPTAAAPASTGDPDIDHANQMLASNDIKGAIRALENLAKNRPQPLSPVLTKALVDAHVAYISQLSTMRGIRPNQLAVLTEVKYDHATRIIDLDPANAMAKSIRQSVLAYFQHEKKILPSR